MLNMFYEEIRMKQSLSCISFCPLRSFYNSKFILIAISLGINAVVIKRVHCINEDTQERPQSRSTDLPR